VEFAISGLVYSAQCAVLYISLIATLRTLYVFLSKTDGDRLTAGTE